MKRQKIENALMYGGDFSREEARQLAYQVLGLMRERDRLQGELDAAKAREKMLLSQRARLLDLSERMGDTMRKHNLGVSHRIELAMLETERLEGEGE